MQRSLNNERRLYSLQSLNAVKQWVRHYKDKGIDGLKEKQRKSSGS
jgi:transposase